MNENSFPDPAPPPDVGRIKEAIGRLRGWRAMTSGIARPPQIAADQVRFALALRGRTDPVALLPRGLDEAQRLSTLDALAGDCDTGARSSRRLWLLRDTARRRVLLSRKQEEGGQAL